MNVTIDPQLRTPVYQQIVNEVKRLIGAGALRPGDRIPSVRELSHTLGINPATAAKAYRELVDAGLLRTSAKSGTFVGSGPASLSPETARARLDEALDRFFAEIAACGPDHHEISTRFQRRLADFVAGRQAAGPQAPGHHAAPAPPATAPKDWAVW
jgi:GntR family transcriptional regulator